MTQPTLALFDIDGTLIWTHGAGRTAMKMAMQSAYGTHGTLDEYDPGGRTMREILELALGDVGIGPEQIDRQIDPFYQHLTDKLDLLLSNGKYAAEPCPGAIDVISELVANPDCVLGIVTGNPQSTAVIKLKRGGYPVDQFVCGAYGSESPVRADLVRSAIGRGKTVTGVDFAPEQIVVLGDTIKDITAGQASGARTIGVCTGGDTYDQLATSNPTRIFTDFTDVDAVCSAIMES